MNGATHPNRCRGVLDCGIRALLPCVFLSVLTTHASARDLLRPGPAGGSSAPVAGVGRSTPADTAAAAVRTRDLLARTQTALQSAQSLQTAARALAASQRSASGLGFQQIGRPLPNVPNGLVPGGLQVAPGVPANLRKPQPGDNAQLWQGAKLPVQTTAGGKTTVTIEQTAPDAVLHWQTFNIGSHTELDFNQSAGGAKTGQWTAFNFIDDPSGNPSQILGSMHAPGQVYLINPNGILFGGASQINLHTLVASSLPLNTNLLQRGLLNNPDAQFLFSALSLPAGPNGTPAFTPAAPTAPASNYGNVVVEPGASIEAPSTAAHVGGRVTLVGPEVINAGRISTPDGQTILAAGLQVGLTAHATADPTVRGEDVYVGAMKMPGAGDGLAGLVENTGWIEADRGNITLAGKNVQQMGIVGSTTSVSLNGSIDLQANYQAVTNTSFTTAKNPGVTPYLFQASGLVTVGAGSVTQILPELNNLETFTGSTLALPSRIELQGRNIHLETNAVVLAPNAQVNLRAGVWRYTSPGNLPQSDFVYSSGQIYLDSGATIDVAGSQDISAPMSQNILSLQLLGAEFADSPVQRNGPLRGGTIDIDIRDAGIFDGQAWVGSPLADFSSFVALIRRTVGQQTIGGGTVNLTAGSSVVTRGGSLIDVSGGWIDYAGGMVQTSRVILGQHVIDISQATPDVVYGGLYTGATTKTDAKCGVSQTFQNPLSLTGRHYEAGYQFGGNGGSLQITAPSMALAGEMLGQTTSGPRQRSIPATPSRLFLAIQGQSDTAPYYLPTSPSPPRIVFGGGESSSAVPAFSLDASGDAAPLPVALQKEFSLSPSLTTQSGFGSLQVENTDGDIVLPAGVNLRTQPGGSITLDGANVTVAGEITTPAGSITLTAHNISPALFAALKTQSAPHTPPPASERGALILVGTASLSASGLVVDDREGSPGAETRPLLTNGGKISLSGYNIELGSQTSLDVSGGVSDNGAGLLAYGSAGSLSILAGQDPLVPSVLGGRLTLHGRLTGFGGKDGGTLTLLAPSVVIGGSTASESALLLTPNFFSTGGWSNFVIEGIGATVEGNGAVAPAIRIAADTVLDPVAESWVATVAGPGEGALGLTPFLKPEGQRPPVNLTFAAVGALDPLAPSTLPAARGDFVMEAGASIRTDALGQVKIQGDTADVLGRIVAPGGEISIAGGMDSTALFADQSQALTTVVLGPESYFSTAGRMLLTPDPAALGRRTGIILSGGNISVSGNVVADAGAVLDVSGATGTVELRPAFSQIDAPAAGSFRGAPFMPTTLDSDAGSITLTGGQQLFSAATLLGSAGGPSALGGSLFVSSGRYHAPGTSSPTPLQVTLEVSRTGPALGAIQTGVSQVGQPIRDSNGKTLRGHGYFASDAFASGGFDSLSLGGIVSFSGPVSIMARASLSVADGGVIFADAPVLLRAPYVKLGQPFQPPLPADQQPPGAYLVDGQPYYAPSTFGAGSLTVEAQLIDVGNLSLRNIGQTNLLAANGDVRGDGWLDVSGRLTLVAGQIYPPTDVSFNIVAHDYVADGHTHPGVIEILGSGIRSTPLSAGGQLNLYGSQIDQGGVLRAPFGSITLGWDGAGVAPADPVSGVAPPKSRQITLARGSITSVSAFDPVSATDLLIPFGVDANGKSWIDPSGLDITTTGSPARAISISSANVLDQAGSVIDLRGGGDLYAYRFFSGLNGTVDILASSGSFAVIPGYSADFAPYAPYNPTPAGNSLGGDAGYVHAGLAAGDRVYLGGSPALSAGYYTLLPARYALLPGAVLVTPQTGTPVGTMAMPDGSSLVSGFAFNDLNSARAGQMLLQSFDVASQAVVRARAEYDNALADSFMNAAAGAQGITVANLPADAGRLQLEATRQMNLQGTLLATAGAGGRGGLVDIASTSNIFITGANGDAAPSGSLVLNAAQLTDFGAGSLLIGGIRRIGANGATVTVSTGEITVDNAGSPLRGGDITLVARSGITLETGATIEAMGDGGAAETLRLGVSGQVGSGDGVLLRVSADSTAAIVRAGVDANATPQLSVASGAQISGAGVILDSTAAASLSAGARISDRSLTLDAGHISLLLNGAGSVPPTSGLVLTSGALTSAAPAGGLLSLLSYSTIDVYGTGRIGNPDLTYLGLHAGAIRGFEQGDGSVVISAETIALDNLPGAVVASDFLGAPEGVLRFTADSIVLGKNTLTITGYEQVSLVGSHSILAQGAGGLSVQGALTFDTVHFAGSAGATQAFVSGGELLLEGSAAGTVSALGVNLSFTGASVVDRAGFILPSGMLTLHATSGDVTIGAVALDVGGVARNFFDVTQETPAGEIQLTADAGNVAIASGATLSVAGAPGGGNAGLLSIAVSHGSLLSHGRFLGEANAGGMGGSFSLDVQSAPEGSLDALNKALNAGGFTDSRSFRVRTGDITLTNAAAQHIDVSTDAGSISVSGFLDASGGVGGNISLAAAGDVTLLSSAKLSVAGDRFNDAGQGGSITLEAGADVGGYANASAILNLQSGSTIDLSIKQSAGLGQASGRLLLRAPQIAGDLGIKEIGSSIHGASSIVAEGTHLQDAHATGVASIDDFESAALANATSLMANAPAIQARLLQSHADLADIFHVRPGEEIDNSLGGLTLKADWDLSTWRFGTPKPVVDAMGNPLLNSNGQPILIGSEPGTLTLRAAGNITFLGSLTDGFGDSAGAQDIPVDSAGRPEPWRETLLPLFADGSSQKSWSYRITAGADFSAADFHRVQSLGMLAGQQGSVLLGVDGGENISVPFGSKAQLASVLQGHYQVIRTGAGSIDVSAGRDVQLLNQFATIYTAGALVGDPTLGGMFDTPILTTVGGQSSLGPIIETTPYPAQFSFGGGNVSIVAQEDILHATRDSAGQLISDSERELPMNWLYRRGDVAVGGTAELGHSGDRQSTAWWIDFSNFFEGVGALGGGNVNLAAGRDVVNVDAAAPTNARLPVNVTSASALVELGGGDVSVQAGRDINAGVYYVERGHGELTAGRDILTNATRAPFPTNIVVNAPAYAPQTWLPTTLFLGKGGFDIFAQGNALLGPVANPFLLPEGYSNSFWYKTYFSTYTDADFVHVASLSGNITLREVATLPTTGLSAATPLLEAWLQNMLVYSPVRITASYYQPWLRLDETDVNPFSTVATLQPPILEVTAFSGNIALDGRLNLAPSASGSLALLSAGSISGLQINGVTTVNGLPANSWAAAVIDVSDANPASIPGVATPFAYQSVVGLNLALARQTGVQLLSSIDSRFAESGAISGDASVLELQEALHTPGPLHRGSSSPVRLYAKKGNISGLTLYTGQPGRIISGLDITDVAFYLQNAQSSDLSLVYAGRDLVAYDPSSPLREAAQAAGNELDLGEMPQAGDIQIGGPGTLEVLAGRNLELGVGPSNANGTAIGIVSVGNERNPFLPGGGANVIAAAGLGPAASLARSKADFVTFASALPGLSNDGRLFAELFALSGEAPLHDANDLLTLSPAKRELAELDLFFLILRDAGRAHVSADAGSPAAAYTSGFAAIESLFGASGGAGDLSLTSREIATLNGGNIRLLAPYGALEVGVELAGNQPLDQGILTEAGGNISIFTHGNVDLGTSRIFTLRGGNVLIWSSAGDIAAGAAGKSVLVAPPTRVVIDPQSADTSADLAGLATGGGIGVLDSVPGTPVGDVDLIAPVGTIDAGDAGIRVTGNLTLSAVRILNPGNIQAGGVITGLPTTTASLPNVALLTAANNATGAAAGEVAPIVPPPPPPEPPFIPTVEAPSEISVQVVSYGDSGDDDDGDENAPGDSPAEPN